MSLWRGIPVLFPFGEMYFCLDANALDGRVACSMWGRLALRFEQSAAASFASLSAASFPFTLL